MRIRLQDHVLSQSPKLGDYIVIKFGGYGYQLGRVEKITPKAVYVRKAHSRHSRWAGWNWFKTKLHPSRYVGVYNGPIEPRLAYDIGLFIERLEQRMQATEARIATSSFATDLKNRVKRARNEIDDLRVFQCVST